MKYVVEDVSDTPTIHEVVNMLNERGQETDDKDSAVSIVIRDNFGEGYFVLPIPYHGVIHTMH